MAKHLKQFRYYGANSDLNYPSNIVTTNSLTSGSAFFGSRNLISIAALGIQTWPGVKFYLNDSTDSIIIGSTGIYELNLKDNYEVTSLRFDKSSLGLIDSNVNHGAYLIIDIVYNTEE